ncbi:hypothetical protein GH714_027082 [Hevea brasiliensis]|uniref:Uncharacterized protein n=1 Tax=Hevea brasiliensis TaxID=3981 RepID=A0A6A6N2I1_HEVBR|nr:hypothetical protein GH714_027082 [Hevea brasiliensis]
MEMEDNQTQIQNPEDIDASNGDTIAQNPKSPVSSDSTPTRRTSPSRLMSLKPWKPSFPQTPPTTTLMSKAEVFSVVEKLYERGVLDYLAKELQVQRIRGIFHRQLSVPLLNLRSTFLAYKAWEVEQGNVLDAESNDIDGIPSHVASAYQKAMEMCMLVFSMKNKFLKRIYLKLKTSNFMNYLKFEKSAGDPARVQVFEKSLQCTFSTLEEYLDLFLTRVDSLRRRILFVNEAEDVLDYSKIRETFQFASDYLSPQLKNSDALLHLHAYWSRLELNLGNDLVAARGVWESLLKISGSMLEAWQGYIAMEIELGHIKEARSIYRRCYCKRFPGTGSEDICHSWLRFEREFGTLEDFDYAVQKVIPRLEELQLYRMPRESKAFAASTDEKEDPIKKNVREKRKEGLAYVDFSDDEHLAAAILKNKQMLLGKKLSIARSDPKQNKKGGHNVSKQHTHTTGMSGNDGESASKVSNETSKGRPRHQSFQTLLLVSKMTTSNSREMGQVCHYQLSVVSNCFRSF